MTNGSVCQGWAVCCAPTDIKGPSVVSIPLPNKILSLVLPGLKPKGRVCVKSGRSGARKPDNLGLSCKATKCSDAGTGDLGVLTTHEISPWFSLGDAAS